MMRWRTTAYAAWGIIGVIILMAASGWIVGQVAGALAPFVIAFLLVFFMQGTVRAFERRGLSRVQAVLTCFGIGFLIVSVIAIFLIPAVSRQIVDFVQRVPTYVTMAEDLVAGLQQRFSTVVVPEWLSVALKSIADSLSQIAVRVGNAVAQGILSAGSSIATVVFDLFLGLVIAFWTLKDLPMIRQELRMLAGKKYEDDLENLIETLSRVVGGYLRGQTVASLVTGAVAGIGLAILGVPYALVLAIITFVLNYVPYIGPFLSGLIAGLVGLFVSPLTAFLAIAIVIGAQQLTDLFVTPRVMSDQVDLHPTLVIFSLLVGGTLFGFWGMIFAIPVAATGKGLFVYYWERRTDRPLATEDGALFRSAQCDESDEPCDDDSVSQTSSDDDDDAVAASPDDTVKGS